MLRVMVIYLLRLYQWWYNEVGW